MSSQLHRWYILTAVTLIVLTSLSGCGYKDRPISPRQVIPLPITDLSYKLDKSGVTLSWSYPRESVTGRDIIDIVSFKIYRAVISPQNYCPACPVPFAAPIIIAGDALTGDNRKRASYQTSLLRPGNMYLFKVRSVAGWWAESKDSNIVSFYWQVPPLAPANLKASPQESAIVLNWQPPTTKLDNTPVSGIIHYQIYRSIGDGPFHPLGKPITETSFVDSDTINRKKYSYRVQSLAVYPHGTVGGGTSDSVSASPLDLTPPPIPSGVRTISTSAGVRVFWEPVRSEDIYAYFIHRRLEGEKTAKKIGVVKYPFNMYMDSEAPEKSTKVFYSVSSIDNNIPGNESLRSTEIEVRR